VDRLELRPSNHTMTTQLSLLDSKWLDCAVSVVLERMKGRVFTSDDLHPILPEPEQRNHYGALFTKMSKQGQIEQVGYTKATRPEAGGHVVRMWRLK
jgi:hypothetical protein